MYYVQFRGFFHKLTISSLYLDREQIHFHGTRHVALLYVGNTGDALEVVFCVLHLHLSTKMNPKGGTGRNRIKKRKKDMEEGIRGIECLLVLDNKM